jgi:hypothetical protein
VEDIEEAKKLLISSRVEHGGCGSNMDGQVRTVASHLNIIQAPEQIEAGLNDNLYIDGKKVLPIKGMPAAKSAEIIYKEFSNRTDLRGGKFHISFKEKCLVAKDQWGEWTRVGANDFAQFINHWFVLVNLIEYDSKPALEIVPKLPLISRSGRVGDLRASVQ